MKQFLTGSSLFMNAVMQRQVSGKLLLVVEGDDEDRILYGHISEPDVTLLVAGGKAEVLEAAHLIHSQRIGGTLALVDRDLDDLTGAANSYPPSAVATEGYDLINDVVRGNTALLDRVLRVHAPGATAAVTSATGMSAAAVAFALALSIAPLRLISEELALGVRFRGFPFSDALTPAFAPKPWPELVALANGRSARKFDLEIVAAHIDSATARVADRIELCGGHDLLGAAGAVLRLAGAHQVSPNHLAASLIAATDCLTVGRLSTYGALQQWAKSHARSAFNCELAA